MNNFVFSIAVLLTQGKRLALCALYVRLNECSKNVIRSVRRYDAVSYADANFLQLFLRERFRVLFPMPKELKLIQSQTVDEAEKVKTSLLKCWGQRWSNSTWHDVPRNTLSQVINDKGSFNFWL